MKTEKIVFHIDDDADDRYFFTEALSGYNEFVIHGFESFEDALQAAPDVKPEVIYMDFWVPGMTATQFLKRLSAVLDLTAVPINVLSGTEVPHFFRELLDAYEVKYKIKPTNPKALRDLLTNDFYQDREPDLR